MPEKVLSQGHICKRQALRGVRYDLLGSVETGALGGAALASPVACNGTEKEALGRQKQ